MFNLATPQELTILRRYINTYFIFMRWLYLRGMQRVHQQILACDVNKYEDKCFILLRNSFILNIPCLTLVNICKHILIINQFEVNIPVILTNIRLPQLLYEITQLNTKWRPFAVDVAFRGLVYKYVHIVSHVCKLVVTILSQCGVKLS